MSSLQGPLGLINQRLESKQSNKNHEVKNILSGFINKAHSYAKLELDQNFNNFITFIDDHLSSKEILNSSISEESLKTGESRNKMNNSIPALNEESKHLKPEPEIKTDQPSRLEEVFPFEADGDIVKFGLNPEGEVNQPCISLDFQILHPKVSILLKSDEKEYEFTPNSSNESKSFSINSQDVEMSYLKGHFLMKIQAESLNSFEVSSSSRLINEHIFQISNAQIIPYVKKSKLTLKYYLPDSQNFSQQVTGEKNLHVDQEGQFALNSTKTAKAIYKIFPEEKGWIISSLTNLKVFRSLHTKSTYKKKNSYPLSMTPGKILCFGEEEFLVVINGKS
jgi:hypothetical protein